MIGTHGRIRKNRSVTTIIFDSLMFCNKMQ
jgi:hypothetical protein